MLADPRERENLDSPLARARRIHLACERFEADWRKGLQPRLEHFVDAVCPEDRAALFGELLPLEIELRRECGDHPCSTEYLARFPDLENLIVQTFRDPELATGDPHATAAWNSATLDSSSPPETASGRPVPAGEERVGDYLLLEEIARGGMGIVYKASHLGLKRLVALKMILSGSLATPAERARFRREAKLCRDLITGVSFHPADRNLPEPVVLEGVEQPAVFLGHHRRELGRGLFSRDHFESRSHRRVERQVAPGAPQRGLFHDPPAAAFESFLALNLGVGLAHRNGHENSPEILAIGKLGKPSLGDSHAKAVERAQGGVLLVGLCPRMALPLQLPPGQDDQPAEIAFPEWLGRRQVAASEVAHPVSDGTPLSVHQSSLRSNGIVMVIIRSMGFVHAHSNTTLGPAQPRTPEFVRRRVRLAGLGR